MTTAKANDPVQKALDMLHLLEPEVREKVMSRMPDEVRERIRMRLETSPDGGARPHSSFSQDIASRRRLLRETSVRVHERKTQVAVDSVEQIHQIPNEVMDAAEAPRQMDPLHELKHVHPAAIARALQGERAEAWAVVLEALAPAPRQALERFLDERSHRAITAAFERQQSLSPGLRMTVQRAIAATVVPRSLREHQMLLTTPRPEANHGTPL